MKSGDFVDVHFPDGCLIGKLISDDGKTVTVEFDNGILTDIPKEIVTEWVSVENRLLVKGGNMTQ